MQQEGATPGKRGRNLHIYAEEELGNYVLHQEDIPGKDSDPS